MRVVSVNVGRPQTVTAGGRSVTSGILKSPVEGRVPLGVLGFEGDGQADPTVHGGPEKAVYLYPSEHYAKWRADLPGTPLPWGAFGENLDIEGLTEAMVHVGDVLRVGPVLLQVTTPRFPCYKLGMKFDDPGMLRRFLSSERSGFYVAVLEPGDVGAGDAIEVVTVQPGAPTILEIVQRKSRRADA
jgi:MOSC domain-containing protein YiiM